MNAYDRIHKKTVEYRNSLKVEETKEDAITVDSVVVDNSVWFTVKMEPEKVDLFKKFCLENAIEIMGGI